MINTREVQSTYKEVESITCDRCNKTWTPDDFVEYQESHHIRFTGGYGSLFGDMSEVTCDLCQSCLYDIIKSYCYIDGERAGAQQNE